MWVITTSTLRNISATYEISIVLATYHTSPYEHRKPYFFAGPQMHSELSGREIIGFRREFQAQMSRNMHSSGDVDRLLDVFCKYQNELNPGNDTNPKHWDHALLFSGFAIFTPYYNAAHSYLLIVKLLFTTTSCSVIAFDVVAQLNFSQ
uniref:Uncharacterized protein n=1 Tax=Parascaris equorum TaxID=6256 RepID=A0A914RLK2_PAREQ